MTERAQEGLVWVARGLVLAICSVVVLWLWRRASWYLSVDQFGYLTFAGDLALGRIAHQWDLVPVLQRFLPPELDVDVLDQTYFLREGHLFCRYAPGFPLLLAVAILIFGTASVHAFNALAAAGLLLVLYFLAARVLASEWQALIACLMAVLLPTYVLLWSISPLRDVPAHAFGLAGLALLFAPRPGRAGMMSWVGAGLLLGFAASIRVDAVLYGIPALALGLWWPRHHRHVAIGLCAAFIGVAPLLGYNWFAMGNPLRPTQGMELNQVLSSLETPSVRGAGVAVLRAIAPSTARAQSALPVPRTRAETLLQGGGLRIEHLRNTLPANLGVFESIFSRFGLGLALVGALAALRNPRVFWLTVPYLTVSVLFFSLWPRPDPRYLLGSILLLILLVVYGARFLAGLGGLLRGWGLPAGVAVPLAAAVAMLLLWGVPIPSGDEGSAQPWVLLALRGALALAILFGAVSAGARTQRVFAISASLAMCLVFAARTPGNMAREASFQSEEVRLAKETVEASTGDRAVIFTTLEVGRPAENINYYTDVSAVYLREIRRWEVTPPYLLEQVLEAGFEAYLLLPPEHARRWIENPFVYPWFRPEMVANIEASDARRWFVASVAHSGRPLWFVRMHRRQQAPSSVRENLPGPGQAGS